MGFVEFQLGIVESKAPPQQFHAPPVLISFLSLRQSLLVFLPRKLKFARVGKGKPSFIFSVFIESQALICKEDPFMLCR